MKLTLCCFLTLVLLASIGRAQSPASNGSGAGGGSARGDESGGNDRAARIDQSNEGGGGGSSHSGICWVEVTCDGSGSGVVTQVWQDQCVGGQLCRWQVGDQAVNQCFEQGPKGAVIIAWGEPILFSSLCGPSDPSETAQNDGIN